MGMISIWDGCGLPPVGCSVFIEHNSDSDLHEVQVAGYTLRTTSDPCHHRVFIDVVYGKSVSTNQRLLKDVYPLTYRKPK